MSCSCSELAAVTGAPIAKPSYIQKHQKRELQLLVAGRRAGALIAKPDSSESTMNVSCSRSGRSPLPRPVYN